MLYVLIICLNVVVCCISLLFLFCFVFLLIFFGGSIILNVYFSNLTFYIQWVERRLPHKYWLLFVTVSCYMYLCLRAHIVFVFFILWFPFCFVFLSITFFLLLILKYILIWCKYMYSVKTWKLVFQWLNLMGHTMLLKLFVCFTLNNMQILIITCCFV